ncbi:MAG: hypothetical protein AAB263_09420 [Planctomycetota bacterium]
MTRRRRLLVLFLVLVVGIPLIAAMSVGVYLRWGGGKRELIHGWTDRGLPGALTVESVHFVSLHEAVIEGIQIAEQDKPALIAARRATVTFDLWQGQLKSAQFEGVTGELDADRLRFLIAIIQAEAKHPQHGQPSPVSIDIRQATLRLPAGIQIDDAVIHVNAVGANASVEATAYVAGRQLRLAIDTARAVQAGPVVVTVEARECAMELSRVLSAIHELGLIPVIPEQVLPYLPGLVDVAGTRVAVDAVNSLWNGQIKAAWQGGGGSAELEVSSRIVAMRKVTLRDERLGGLHGEVKIDRRLKTVAVDADEWGMGSGIKIPSLVPMTEIAKALPKLQIRWPTNDRRLSVAVVGTGQSRLELVVGGEQPPRLLASELELSMAQRLLPSPLLILGGNIVSATASLDPGREEMVLQVRQARLVAEGWSFGALDGEVAARALPAAGIQVRADLYNGTMIGERAEIGRVSFTGTRQAGTLTIACKKIEALLARLAGPMQLPQVNGSIALEADYSITPERSTIDIKSLAVGTTGVADMQLLGRDFVRAVSAKMRGQAVFMPGNIDIGLQGQLLGGSLRLPGLWMDAAARTPIFSVQVGLVLRREGLAEIQLKQALVRSADAKGEPIVGGYSAGFTGALIGEHLAGTISGVVDHADLNWVASLISASQVKIAGEGAIVCAAQFNAGEVRRIDGTVLPLGADLDIDRGRLVVEGITGGITFSIGGQKP